MERVRELLSRELGDSIFFSFLLFQHTEGQVWHTKHVHNFDRKAVRDAMVSVIEQWDEEGYDEDDNDDFFSSN